MSVEMPPTVQMHFCTSQELPYVRDSLIWQREEQAQNAFSQAQLQLDGCIEQFIHLSERGEQDAAYTLWSDLIFDYFSFLLSAYNTRELSSDASIKEEVVDKIKQLQAHFQRSLSDNTQLLQVFIAHAMHADGLTPQHRWFTESILKEYQQEKSHASSRDLERALDILASKDKAAFAVAEGMALPLDPDALEELSILTANIICFPGTLTYTYGGISPWEQRIDKIVEKIVETDAAIVTLQEVWDPRAMRQLIEKLKTHYAYFVYDAGDPAGTLQLSQMGYNSGLFIAAKVPLEHIKFERFSRSIPQGSNRGTLLVTSHIADHQFSLINTHLQHGNDPEQRAIRKEQLAACSERLGEQTTRFHYLVGDLNINALTNEHETSELTRLFCLTHALTEDNSPTCTEYFNDLVMTPFEQRVLTSRIMEHLDYCISPTDMPAKQQLIPLFTLDEPTQALSDHHALLTIWK